MTIDLHWTQPGAWRAYRNTCLRGGDPDSNYVARLVQAPTPF
jgi:hypothetical protein